MTTTKDIREQQKQNMGIINSPSESVERAKEKRSPKINLEDFAFCLLLASEGMPNKEYDRFMA